jgi:hypothetical protein
VAEERPAEDNPVTQKESSIPGHEIVKCVHPPRIRQRCRGTVASFTVMQKSNGGYDDNRLFPGESQGDAIIVADPVNVKILVIGRCQEPIPAHESPPEAIHRRAETLRFRLGEKWPSRDRKRVSASLIEPAQE